MITMHGYTYEFTQRKCINTLHNYVQAFKTASQQGSLVQFAHG